MNVILLQPPDPLPPVTSFDPESSKAPVLSPPWDLLCLRSYLLSRTRHTATVLDCRLFSRLEPELIESLSTIEAPRMLVISTSTLSLGEVTAVLEITRRHMPNMRTVLMGQHPSQFPMDSSLLGRADFALAGDPEPILRNLLDYIDVEQRVKRIPGLIYPGCDRIEPYWLDDLKSLSLPDWEGLYWNAYESTGRQLRLQMRLRLSRGHTKERGDRAFGNMYEPLRAWPFSRVAPSIDKLLPRGVTEVMIDESPHFWTVQRMVEWCTELERVHNTIGWGLQLFPQAMHEDLAARLRFAGCRRVDLIVPTCDRSLMSRFDFDVSMGVLQRTIRTLRHAKMHVYVRFWVGGPEEALGEADRICDAIRALDYFDYSLEPFPFNVDMPMIGEVEADPGTPTVEDWLAWSRDPWIVDQPTPSWGGEQNAEEIAKTIHRVQHQIARSPRRWMKRILEFLLSRNWIDAMEQKAVGALPRRT